MTDRFHNHTIGLCLLFLIALGSIVFWPGVSGPFLLDDLVNIPKSYIHAFTYDELAAASWANTSGTLKRPVSALSFALTQWITGTDASGFKIHNILIHLCIGLIVFITSRRIFSALNFNQQQQNWAAIGCTAFWLLHPLHVSTVLYPVQRMAQLAALFTLLSIYSYLRARQNNHWIWLICVFPAASLLAIFSKENGALIPLFVLLIEAVLFHFKTNKSNRYFLVFWLIAIAIPLVVALAYLTTHPSMLSYNSRDFTLIERLYTQAFTLLQYLVFIIIPNINDMGIFHDDIIIRREWSLTLALALSFHISLLAIGFYLRQRFTLASLTIGWFYVAHMMESTIFPLELMFEHRNYLALLGLALLFGGVAAKLKPSAITVGIIILFLSQLALSTYERASLWKSAKSLYQATALNHPRSSRAHIAYANEILKEGELQLAVKLLLKAYQLNKADAGPLLHIIKVSCFGPTTFDPQFYFLINQNFSQNSLTPYGQQSLHQISKRYSDGNCSQLNTDKFFSILDSIEKRHPDRRHEILLIKARMLSLTDIKQSMIFYRESYALSHNLRTLSEQAAILIKHNNQKEAITIIDQLLKKQDRFGPTLTREFRELINWHKKKTSHQ